MVRIEGEAVVKVNGTEAGQQIDKLEKKVTELRAELIGLRKQEVLDAKKIKATEKAIRETNQEMRALKKNTFDYAQVLNNMKTSTPNEIRKVMNRLSYELGGLKRGTEQYIEKNKQLKLVKAEWEKVRLEQAATRTGFSKWVGTVADGFTKYFALATTAVMAFAGVAMSIKNVIGGLSEMSDKIADVQKTTSLTKGEVISMGKAFKGFNTRTSQQELLGLARIVGKLGTKGKQDITAFVKEANKINVALSEDLGGDVEETIRQLGKLTETFKISEVYGQAEALNKVGSAINSIGASSTANEGYLVEFAKRMAGVAPTAGMSITQVLGLASALDQLGQSEEVAGTVMSQILPNMFKNTEIFAEVAGMSVKNFSKLLEKDVNEALIKVLQGLNGNNAGLGQMAKKLDALDIDGQRAISVLGVLANNTELLRQEQALANTEFEKGTSLQEEYNIKNENTAASVEKIQKALYAMFMNNALTRGIENMINLMGEWTELNMSDTIREEQTELNVLVTTITGANVGTMQRVELIKQLNANYPDFLGNLNAETVTNDQLKDRLKEVNGEYEKKILLQLRDEEIKDKRKNIAELALKELDMLGYIAKQELALKEALNETERKQHLSYIKQHQETLAKIRQERADLEFEIQKIMVRYDQASALLNKKPNTANASTFGGGNPLSRSSTPGNESLFTEPVKNENIWFNKETFDPKNIKVFGTGPSSNLSDRPKTKDFGTGKGTSDSKKDRFSERVTDYEAVKESYKQELMDEDKHQRDMMKLNVEGYEAQKENYKKANKEEKDDAKKTTDELIAEYKRRYDAASELSGALNSVFQTYSEIQKQRYGEDSEQYKKSRKTSIMFQLAADQASAYSALAAASAGNPLNGPTGGIAGTLQYAAGIVQIINNFARAYSAFKEIEGYAQGSFTNVSGGGGVGNKQLAWFGEEGREYVIPNPGVENPTLAPVIDVIEQARRNGTIGRIDFGKLLNQRISGAFAQGGSTMQNTNTAAPQQPVNTDALLLKLIAEVRNLNQRPVKARVSYFDIDDARKKIEEIKERVTPSAKA